MQRRAATSMSLTSALLILYSMPVIADEHEGDGAVATPIEIYTCNYADGKTQKDFDAVTAKFNAWADDAGMTEYSAWQLMPFYSSPTQDFDFVWLGASPSAQSMGRDQDKWFATGGKIAEEFEKVTPCHTHANFAALEFKEPPERTTPDSIAVSFSDCTMADDVSFGDVAPKIAEWAEYRGAAGSKAGIWVFFPAMGGGDEEYDFKYVTAHDNMEDHGADWDHYSREGWQKADEMFADLLSCNSSRVYMARNLRRAADDE